MNIAEIFILIIVGLSGGIAVGSGFVAFITVLDVVPRLVQLSRAREHLLTYEYAIVLGVIFFTVIDFWSIQIPIIAVLLIPIGLMMGMFIGILAAALTEVLNVFPILMRRLRMQVHLLLLLMAMALGKTLGSLYQWLIFKVW